jgi:hypothetical protein
MTHQSATAAASGLLNARTTARCDAQSGQISHATLSLACATSANAEVIEAWATETAWSYGTGEVVTPSWDSATTHGSTT